MTIGLRIPLLPERYVVFRTGEEKRELGIEEEPCYFFFNRRIMYIIMQEINSQLHVVTQSIQPRRSILLSHGTGIDPDIMIERFCDMHHLASFGGNTNNGHILAHSIAIGEMDVIINYYCPLNHKKASPTS